MEIETLKAMNESLYLSLLMGIKIIVLISAFCAIAGFAIYLGGIVWLCFEERREPARRRLISKEPRPISMSKQTVSVAQP